MALGLGAEVFRRQSAALGDRPDLTEMLERSPVPTLVLCGEKDAICPPERHERMNGSAGGSRLEVIPGAGHLPMLERPAATTIALENWLAD
jgi:pimeloyl-ACP methyl ester carboxylesterase